MLPRCDYEAAGVQCAGGFLAWRHFRIRWRRTQRRFCSDPCKYDYHTLKRVKALLNKVGVIEFRRVFDLW
jgi:hypothetical protein